MVNGGVVAIGILAVGIAVGFVLGMLVLVVVSLARANILARRQRDRLDHGRIRAADTRHSGAQDTHFGTTAPPPYEPPDGGHVIH